MRVNVICGEDLYAWILGKFARKIHENLGILGIESKISKVADPEYDINHHIIYLHYNSIPSNIDTLMVTHIDNISKLNLIKKQLNIASMGICMSRETMDRLKSFGIPGERLTYVNPAQDGVIKPRKFIVGITCYVQNDGRKREFFIDKLSKEIDPDIFMFKIMGGNWDAQVRTLKSSGFEVEYDNQFNYDKYTKLIPSLDYYLYMGQDEGQMGFLDALAAGVKTIVTPQGYHLDAQNGITFPFNNYEELLSVFKKISDEKMQLINSVRDWNWNQYTLKHVEIWKYLLAKRNNTSYVFPSEMRYPDGLNPLLKPVQQLPNNFDKKKEVNMLRRMYVRHIYFKVKNKIGKSVSGNN